MNRTMFKTDGVQDYESLHLSRLRTLAPECMVLLKTNGDFPLTQPCALALYGSGARRTIKGGGGSGDVHVRHAVTVEEGLERAGFTITTKAWLDAYDDAASQAMLVFKEEIRQQAAKEGRQAFFVRDGREPAEPAYQFPLNGAGDVCIYVLARNSEEGADRSATPGSLLLTQDEIRDILACAKNYRKFMLVLNVGAPVDLSPIEPHTANILLLSQLGSVTGNAFADVLLGKAYPSGKLTATWPRAEASASIGDFGFLNDIRYREGIFVGYRYYDAADVKPLFRFGFGLSYTSFDTQVQKIGVSGGVLSVCTQVLNTGSHCGRETVQLYYSAPSGKLLRPMRELGAYQKTAELLPGQAQTLTLCLPLADMAGWDTENASWLLEKGQYLFFIDDKAICTIELDGDAVTQKLHALGGETDFTDWAPAMPPRRIPDGLPSYTVSAAEMIGFGHYTRDCAPGSEPDLPDLSAFTDTELAAACLGRYQQITGIDRFLGSEAFSFFSVAGSVGETAEILQHKGIGRVNMADGPAGLRLANHYLVRGENAEGLDKGAFAPYQDLFTDDEQRQIEEKYTALWTEAKTQDVGYQYPSAIPIGTALAQSWNPEMIEACGDLVGEEMELFGVGIWLAPALNIHRSPLCGRNFEYYSEDPLLSGLTAAAMTRGVQQHPGCAVTIKHFCCNNQESRRTASNSMVSQRALREIYLKGFEICVKQAAPRCLMTSYNLLNGTHTANRRDLVTGILREEWGYKGLVMSDWFTTVAELQPGEIYAATSPTGCLLAGNDLIMPGTPEDLKQLTAARRSGELPRAVLETCAGRVAACTAFLTQAR